MAGFSGIVLGPLVAGLFLASWSILREQRDEDEEALRIAVDATGRVPNADDKDARGKGTGDRGAGPSPAEAG